MAMDDDHFVGTFKVQGEAGRSWFVGHRAFSGRVVVNWRERFGEVSHTAALVAAENPELRHGGGCAWTVSKEGNGTDAAGERSRWRSGFLQSAAHDETVSCCGRNDIFLIGINFSCASSGRQGKTVRDVSARRDAKRGACNFRGTIAVTEVTDFEAAFLVQSHCSHEELPYWRR
jgi:hypothetical protein